MITLAYLTWTDIAFERTDAIDDDSAMLNLTEVLIFGLPDSAEEKIFTLVEVSPGRWEMNEAIQLHPNPDSDGIDFVVKSGQSEHVAFVHLDAPRMRNSKLEFENDVTEQLCDYGYRRFDAFVQTGNVCDLTEASSALHKALELTPPGHSYLPSHLHYLGMSLRCHFEQTGRSSDITKAILVQRRALSLTPTGHPNLLLRLNKLDDSLECRFQLTGDLSDIAEVISVQMRALELTRHGHADLPIWLNSLGRSLTRRFRKTGELSDITNAISIQQRAVDLTPQGDANLPGRFGSLALSLGLRFQWTGELLDITRAISLQQRAVDLAPQDHPQLLKLLSNLGSFLADRFGRTGELSDVTDAIDVLRRAVDPAPQGHPSLPAWLSNLGASLTHRFECTGELSDINEAIAVQQRAVDLAPKGHANLPSWLNNLGGSLNCRFERTGELSDITKAISMRQRAIDLIPQGHVSLPIYLNGLAGSLTRRFECTGELSEINQAISALQRAVAHTPEGHVHMPSHLTNLGNSFAIRFGHTAELSDLTEAISVQRRAVNLAPQGHRYLPGWLNNLGGSLQQRYFATRALSDITEAISAHQKAVDLTPQGHPDLPGWLNNLGISLTWHSKRTNKISDISEVILVQRRAVDLAPQGHAGLAGWLNNLSDSLTRRFLETHELGDIAEAVSTQLRAVDLTPKGHPSLPVRLGGLASSLYCRSLFTCDNGDREESLRLFKAAALCTAGSPGTKLLAAKRWAKELIQLCPQPSTEIVLAFDTALDSVGLIAGLERTVRGRYTQLENISGLALEAAAAAFGIDRADKALEWLEQGRCLVWTQLNSLRTPLDDLRVHNKGLAKKIDAISRQLDNAGSSRGAPDIGMSLEEKISLEDEARVHLGLVGQWNDVLRTARAIPGFQSFLMPSPCSALMQHLPESGPIVVINVHDRRCDALALLAGLDEPLHIPLPNFSVEKSSKYRAVLDSQLRTRNLRVREVGAVTSIDGEVRGIRSVPIGEHGEDPPVQRVLRGLWEEVVKPILTALGFSRIDRTSEKAPPRIWWCPTGPLSFLPLHAAGIYRGSDSEGVFHYAVSSYTPTVTAITSRVKKHRSIEAEVSGLFLTSQPNVTGASSIPGTTKEVRSIFEKGEGSGVRMLKLEGNDMTVDTCLDRMHEFSSIHLACHGSQNAAEPLQSRFLFHQGSLDLGTIIRSNLKNADLAFLSACQTSTGDEKISDEAVHLVAGMLAAGYRRVVGTMWSIGDQPAQEVATTFYDYLFTHRDGTNGTFDGTLSAYALHDATEKLRLSLNESENSLLTWVPFVHFGY
ncbi:hypothetical protein D9611_013741 [Ephemerocybe angulata]|uniref:CHAT domain-containing protein n=1 Tax=Ephemerocybe angulata TaxID=980116 RepID=A0A8H5BCA0_9AGAR|nr:hypothetical protein D9611_013741 [Tulosesus angulatus]